MRSPNTWPGISFLRRAHAPADLHRTSEANIHMNSLPRLGRPALGRTLLLAAALAAAPAYSQSDTGLSLEPVVVVATRTPEDIATLGSAADLISASDLAREQIYTPAAALGAIPGAPAFANGAPGSDLSVFLRGADSDQTLFLVDGIRLNDANTDYAVFLGGARLGSTDSIEVVRGPQSTLYGSEAVGGVVSLEAQKGSGPPSSDIQVEAGSFGTVDGALATQGSQGPWAWSLSASGTRAENDRANNAFHGANLVLRLDRDLTPSVAVGATLRGFEGHYGDPGDIYTDDPYAHEDESNWLATVFADLRPTPEWTARITLGGQDRRYVSFDEDPGVFSETTLVRNQRAVLDAQATYTGLAGHKLTAGVNAEDESTFDNGYGAIDQRQRFIAAFAQDEWHPLQPLYLTGGLRYDDFDTFGSAVTGRATAAWLLADRTVKLRASYGTGFNAPSFLELYGVSTGYVGNPGLRAEHSRGGDVGVDWYLPGKRGSLGATLFRNDTSDLIEYNFNVYPGTTVNVGRARTDGLELEARLALAAGVELHAAYTYLEADDLTDGTRLLRRPRNSASADLWRDFGGGFDAGAGVQLAAGVADVDALTYLTVNDPDYAVLRIYARWRPTRSLALKLRVENLLNKSYQPVNGYPALGIGAYGAVEWAL
jgi:vitamin B12 transporter